MPLNEVPLTAVAYPFAQSGTVLAAELSSRVDLPCARAVSVSDAVPMPCLSRPVPSLLLYFAAVPTVQALEKSVGTAGFEPATP